MKPEVFIQKIVPEAVRANTRTGIPASVSIAQAILESGWGKSQLTKDGNNLFGIKAGTAWKGRTLVLPTKEFYKGKWVTENAKWRAYDSWEDSIVDHSTLFYNGKYETALSFRTQPKEFLREIATIYATDPEYFDKVWQIITQYKLTQYDVHPKKWNLETKLVPKVWYHLWAKVFGVVNV